MERRRRPSPQVRLRHEQANEVESNSPPSPGRIRSQRQKWQAVQGEVFQALLRYTTHIDTSHPKDDWSYEE